MSTATRNEPGICTGFRKAVETYGSTAIQHDVDRAMFGGAWRPTETNYAAAAQIAGRWVHNVARRVLDVAGVGHGLGEAPSITRGADMHALGLAAADVLGEIVRGVETISEKAAVPIVRVSATACYLGVNAYHEMYQAGVRGLKEITPVDDTVYQLAGTLSIAISWAVHNMLRFARPEVDEVHDHLRRLTFQLKALGATMDAIGAEVLFRSMGEIGTSFAPLGLAAAETLCHAAAGSVIVWSDVPQLARELAVQMRKGAA